MLTGGPEWQISGVGGTQTPAEIEAGAGTRAQSV
jgi:hypothetical protein